MLSLYRRLIDLRRAEPALSIGRFEPLECHDDVLTFVRFDENRRLMVALNFSSTPRTIDLASLVRAPARRILLSTHLDRASDAVTSAAVSLRPDEGLILEL